MDVNNLDLVGILKLNQLKLKITEIETQRKTCSISQLSSKANLGGNRNKVNLTELENTSDKFFQALIF